MGIEAKVQRNTVERNWSGNCVARMNSSFFFLELWNRKCSNPFCLRFSVRSSSLCLIRLRVLHVRGSAGSQFARTTNLVYYAIRIANWPKIHEQLWSSSVRWAEFSLASIRLYFVSRRLLNDPLLLLLGYRMRVLTTEQQQNGHTCCVRWPNFPFAWNCSRAIATKMRSRAPGKRVVDGWRRSENGKFLRARQKVRTDGAHTQTHRHRDRETRRNFADRKW